MLIYGAGGHARVVADCVLSQGLQISAFFDDALREPSFLGKEVVLYAMDFFVEKPLIIAIGDNVTRKQISERVHHEFGAIRHTSSVISPSATIAKGSVIIHRAVVQAQSSIGRHTIVNTGAIVDHDCEVGHYVHVGPGSTLCAGVCLGEGAWVGAGAIVLPRIRVGRWAVIGAGSVVTRDVEEGSVVAGNPARTIKNMEV